MEETFKGYLKEWWIHFGYLMSATKDLICHPFIITFEYVEDKFAPKWYIYWQFKRVIQKRMYPNHITIYSIFDLLFNENRLTQNQVDKLKSMVIAETKQSRK